MQGFRPASLLILLLPLLAAPSVCIAREYLQVFVTEPYLELRTGPGRGYPITQVVPRAESVDILKRRTDYFKKVGFISSDGVTRGSIGTNPCAEIILQSKQFCNLSEVIARANDTEASLLRKARIASILGTYQSTLTNFRYISKEWIDNCSAERLLGVSVTGQWDSPVARNADTMRKIRDVAVKTNATYAKRFGVSQSMAVAMILASTLLWLGDG